jgi:hypothetical protein
VLRILSPLKSIDLGRVWTRTLGPVASTLTTGPPTATTFCQKTSINWQRPKPFFNLSKDRIARSADVRDFQCFAYVQTLKWAEPLSLKQSYKMPSRFKLSEIILSRNTPHSQISWGWRRSMKRRCPAPVFPNPPPRVCGEREIVGETRVSVAPTWKRFHPRLFGPRIHCTQMQHQVGRSYFLTVQAMKIISDQSRTYLEIPDAFRIKAWPFKTAQQQCKETKVEAWSHSKQCTLQAVRYRQTNYIFKHRLFGSYFTHITFVIRTSRKKLCNINSLDQAGHSNVFLCVLFYYLYLSAFFLSHFISFPSTVHIAHAKLLQIVKIKI